jgi:hypothetical protein
MLSKVLILAALSAASATKVCIFDIDHTLTRGSKASASQCSVNAFGPSLDGEDVAAFGSAAIQACVAMNFTVAVASAEASWYVEGKKPFLTDVSEGLFDDKFFASEAFQHGGLMPALDKKPEYTAILSYFQTTPNCAVVFDDSNMNGKSATDLGLNWIVASASCGGSQLCNSACGLTESEFNDGIKMLNTACP